VKRKLPKEVPMPGSFRTGNDAAPAAQAEHAQEENA
jgi:large subunit ribosomal protein L3